MGVFYTGVTQSHDISQLHYVPILFYQLCSPDRVYVMQCLAYKNLQELDFTDAWEDASLHQPGRAPALSQILAMESYLKFA